MTKEANMHIPAQEKNQSTFPFIQKEHEKHLNQFHDRA